MKRTCSEYYDECRIMKVKLLLDTSFMISDSRNDKNKDKYVEQYQRYNVSTIVRLSEPYYDSTIIEKKKKEFILLNCLMKMGEYKIQI